MYVYMHFFLGKRVHSFHQNIKETYHPKVKKHILLVTCVLQVSEKWKEFYYMFPFLFLLIRD